MMTIVVTSILFFIFINFFDDYKEKFIKKQWMDNPISFKGWVSHMVYCLKCSSLQLSFLLYLFMYNDFYIALLSALSTSFISLQILEFYYKIMYR